MKLCKDCDHSRRALIGGWKYAVCDRPSISYVIDPVDGNKRKELGKSFCSMERSLGHTKYTDHCGSEAKYFKQTTKSKLMKWLGK